MISLNSSAAIEFGMPFRPRADSDDAKGRFRAYEIAGGDHRGTREPFGGDLRSLCAAEISDFPLHHYNSLTIVGPTRGRRRRRHSRSASTAMAMW